MSYAEVSDHRSMALDLRRNQAYRAALRQRITPESVVLDLGAGLGVHGLLAARLGAKRVFLVDTEDVLSVAAEIADANGLSSQVECIQGRIEEVDLPEQVDVILSVLTGNMLLIEDLLPSLFTARDRFLKAQGSLIPQGGILKVAPVSAREDFDENVATWSAPHLDLSFEAARRYAANSLFFPKDNLEKSVILAAPQVAVELDFFEAKTASCDAELRFTISTGGECHGIAGWPEINLAGDWFSTAPELPATHWTPALLPLDPPLEVETGDELFLSLTRPPRGDWTWRVKIDSSEQTHSTFFSQAMTPGRLAKSTVNGSPTLSRRGLAAHWVLSQLDGTATLGQIGADLAKEFPEVFTDESDALSYVQHLAREYA
jgi:SAM-dependent methyltransferase